MAKRHDVLIIQEDQAPLPQPDTFRCCPLGLQFYSPQELPLYKVLALKVNAPQGTGTPAVDCSGIVVHCQHETPQDRYRVWVLFSDLPEATRKQLKCIANACELKCPHCENF